MQPVASTENRKWSARRFSCRNSAQITTIESYIDRDGREESHSGALRSQPINELDRELISCSKCSHDTVPNTTSSMQ
jgi:hypothetical protein